MAKLTAKGLERRSEILAAADDYFREFGYEGTSLRMIAQQVNISCGHLEHYFGEKKDIIYELSDTMISNIWESSIDICRDWKDDPFIAYAFAVHWLFQICSHLPDIRLIMFEYLKNIDNHLVFSNRFADRYIGILDTDEADPDQIRTAVNMAFAAQISCLNQYDDRSFTDAVARRTSEEHIRIMCLLQHKEIEEAERISKLVWDTINEYTIERLIRPFTKTYRWYVIENHPFKY